MKRIKLIRRKCRTAAVSSPPGPSQTPSREVLGKSLQQLGRETLFNELIDVAADFVNMIVLQEDDVIEETYKKASIIVCVISVGSFLA